MAKRGPGRPPHDDTLTPAEWAVVEFVRHGLTNRAIAERQQVSLDAVKFHVGNALGKLGMKSRAELRRWDGVRRDSALRRWEKDMATAASGQAMLGPLGQIARSVSDIAAAEAWYRDILGLPHLFTFGELAFFDCGGTRLYLHQDPKGAKPESILYFRAADIHAAARALGEKGVEFVSAPHMVHRHEDGTEEWMAFFNDLDGRPLALMAQAAAAS
jgi:DNA-binding CsgD family transcriptional regulator/catechol 2,3-dioxygenase-like lactoylglutathione lyase family enzyme